LAEGALAAPLDYVFTDALATEGWPFSHIVLDDLYAHVSGVVATDLPGAAAPPGDVEAEAEACLAAIAAALAEVGLGLDRVVRALVHLTDLGQMDALNRAWVKHFPEGRQPARTCVEAPRLAGGCAVEITVTARR
jgi:2-iminobutanoate/2-iminopropanoate deaminase